MQVGSKSTPENVRLITRARARESVEREIRVACGGESGEYYTCASAQSLLSRIEKRSISPESGRDGGRFGIRLEKTSGQHSGRNKLEKIGVHAGVVLQHAMQSFYG